MASLNSLITKDPEVLGGTPVFFLSKRSWITSKAEKTLDEFLDDFPAATREAAVHALEACQDART